MNKKGFTLVEMLAVIVILGIIIAIAVPATISTSKKTKNQMHDTKVNMIEKAAELYGQDKYDPNNTEAEIVSLKQLMEKNYLKKDDNKCEEGKCIKDPLDNTPMDNQNVCICIINKSVVAEFIGNNNSCNGTVCDPSNTTNPDKPTPDPGEIVGPPPLPPTPTQYTLTYDNQSGNGCTNKTVDSGNEWGELCTPTRTNYNFDGWYTGTNGNGTKITSATTASGNITVYAKWNSSQYTLTYNNQSGSGCTSTIVDAGSVWGTLCTPTRTNYTFGGWYTGTNGSGTKITSSTTASSDLTVYANWNTSNYELTYADSVDTAGCTIKKKTAAPNTEWGTLCGSDKYYKSVTCTGSSFKTTSGSCGYFFGWYTEAKCQGTEIKSTTRATQSLTVYACIKNKQCNYEKTYNNDSGSIADRFVATYHCDRVSNEGEFYQCRRSLGTSSSRKSYNCPDSYCLTSGSITLNNNGCAQGSYHTVNKAGFSETISCSCTDSLASSLSSYYK